MDKKMIFKRYSVLPRPARQHAVSFSQYAAYNAIEIYAKGGKGNGSYKFKQGSEHRNYQVRR